MSMSPKDPSALRGSRWASTEGDPKATSIWRSPSSASTRGCSTVDNRWLWDRDGSVRIASVAFRWTIPLICPDHIWSRNSNHSKNQVANYDRRCLARGRQHLLVKLDSRLPKMWLKTSASCCLNLSGRIGGRYGWRWDLRGHVGNHLSGWFLYGKNRII